MMDLSIIMINHNTRELTNQAIKSILESELECSYEIIVVDNSDRINEKIEYKDSHVKILSDVENRGFAHGCNQGVLAASGIYYLFLNSDTVMHKKTIDRSLCFLKKHPDVGGLGVKLIKADGTLDHACRRGFPTPWNAFCYFCKLDRVFPKIKLFNGYCLRYLDDKSIHEIDAVNGAYLMMPSKVFNVVGGWDETFFMYGEDLDLCFKIHKYGYKIVYDPRLTCTHLKGKSGRDSSNPIVQYHFYNAMIIFYQRYYSQKYCKFISKVIIEFLKNKANKYKRQATL